MDDAMPPLRFLMHDTVRIACRTRSAQPPRSEHDARRPGVLFCGGFRSDMNGRKAVFLDAAAAAAGLAFTRFDYRGHGQSSGRFEDGTISAWLSDATASLDRATSGPQILVGSSMGGWIVLLLARIRPERVRGLLLISPAPDFPDRLLKPTFDARAWRALAENGVWRAPSTYDRDGTPITRAFLDDAPRHAVLDAPPIRIAGPVRIVHGGRDAEVPPDYALRTAAVLSASDLRLEILADGDHRLSEPPHLERLRIRLLELVSP